MRTKRPLSSGGYRGVLFLYGIHSCFYRCSPRVVFCNIARIMIAYTPPIRAVISCVTENCSCRTCNIGCIFTGNIFGKIIREIRIPINRAFNTAPITTDTGSPAFSPNFFVEQGNNKDENCISDYNAWKHCRNGCHNRASGDEKGCDRGDDT
mgnify:CR=1 FL=1